MGDWKKCGGFTLLELIYVIAIMAVILAAALPSLLAKQMERAGQEVASWMEINSLQESGIEAAVVGIYRHKDGDWTPYVVKFNEKINPPLQAPKQSLAGQNFIARFNGAKELKANQRVKIILQGKKLTIISVLPPSWT